MQLKKSYQISVIEIAKTAQKIRTVQAQLKKQMFLYRKKYISAELVRKE